ncbi:hypothetical protein [Paenibacillus sp. Soil766]|uniref:hypothetical protein n=1 Tax=Paenibacillus sp. Soil766 TaxID=1736404 RepID=UPI000AEDB1C1|nr:hypothetical protein [Paenibacillus sp. Soil766]
MEKDKPVSLEIKDVLRHLGLDLQQFLLWQEGQSKKSLQVNLNNAPLTHER